MSGHVKLLGILHIVFGFLGLFGGLVLMAIFGGIATLVNMVGQGGDGAAIAVPIISFLGVALCAFMIILSIPGIVVGFGLLNRRPWARILTIILSGFELLSFPFGTIIGAYGLWVLLSPATEREFYPAIQPAHGTIRS